MRLTWFTLPLLLLGSSKASPLTSNKVPKRSFNHPGLLQNAEDFARIQNYVEAETVPWITGWYKLTNNTASQLGYEPHPVAGLCRGNNANCTQNYNYAYTDYAACYQHALRWWIEGDDAYADEAVKIINAWSSTMTSIAGIASDRFLAAGIYGYQFANCVELMRGYPGFTEANFTSALNLLNNVYLPANKFFLETHIPNNTVTHYWANWDLCNIASALSIGVVSDDWDTYNYALQYFYNGAGEGSIDHWLWVRYDDNTAQSEESGRDQGHTMLDLALAGPIATTALNQGTDLWGYQDNRILAGAEYAAKYNLGYNVSYTPFITYLPNGQVEYNQSVISPVSRGDIRPIWEMYYNEYVVKRGLQGTYTEMYANLVRQNGSGAEGGGGNYGPNSGGYDQLGFGTLLYTLPGSDAEPDSSAVSLNVSASLI